MQKSDSGSDGIYFLQFLNSKTNIKLNYSILNTNIIEIYAIF